MVCTLNGGTIQNLHPGLRLVNIDAEGTGHRCGIAGSTGRGSDYGNQLLLRGGADHNILTGTKRRSLVYSYHAFGFVHNDIRRAAHGGFPAGTAGCAHRDQHQIHIGHCLDRQIPSDQNFRAFADDAVRDILRGDYIDRSADIGFGRLAIGSGPYTGGRRKELNIRVCLSDLPEISAFCAICPQCTDSCAVAYNCPDLILILQVGNGKTHAYFRRSHAHGTGYNAYVGSIDG